MEYYHRQKYTKKKAESPFPRIRKQKGQQRRQIELGGSAWRQTGDRKRERGMCGSRARDQRSDGPDRDHNSQVHSACLINFSELVLNNKWVSDNDVNGRERVCVCVRKKREESEKDREER